MKRPRLSEMSTRQLGDEARRLNAMGDHDFDEDSAEALDQECRRRGLELHEDQGQLTVRRVTIEEF